MVRTKTTSVTPDFFSDEIICRRCGRQFGHKGHLVRNPDADPSKVELAQVIYPVLCPRCRRKKGNV